MSLSIVFRSGSVRRRLAALLLAAGLIAVLAVLAAERAEGKSAPVPEPLPAAVPSTASSAACASGALVGRRVTVLSANPITALALVAGGASAMRTAPTARWYVRVGEGRDCDGTLQWSWRSYWTANVPASIAIVYLPDCRYVYRSVTWIIDGNRTREGAFEHHWFESGTNECGSTFKNHVDWSVCHGLRDTQPTIVSRYVYRPDMRIAYRVDSGATRSCFNGIQDFDPPDFFTFTVPTSCYPNC